MMAHRVRSVAAVVVLALSLTSCARTSIEELGRNAIRDDATTAMETSTHITSAVDSPGPQSVHTDERVSVP